MSYDTWKLRSDREYECDCPRCSATEEDDDFWGGSLPPYEDEPEPVTLRPTFSEPVTEFNDEVPF